MSYNLFLDDIRMPYEVGNYFYPVDYREYFRLKKWEIVRNYPEFVSIIEEKGIPLLISFDHDLALIHYDNKTGKQSFSYQEETGYDCAKWLLNYCKQFNLKFPEYFVHSMNPVGRENIIDLIKNYK